MIFMRTSLCHNPILNSVLIFTLTASVTCQTVSINIPPCFGISSTVHTSELHPMHEGAAFTFKTPSEGLQLTSELSTNFFNPLACNYAFSVPTHPQYHSITIFIKRFELNTRSNGFINLLFIGGSKIVSNLLITKSSPIISNANLDTNTWLRNETVIYMFLMHNLPNETSTFHLDIALTPTYLCFLNTFQYMGSYIKKLNPGERTLPGLSEMFHPGWLLCTTPVHSQDLGYKVAYRYMAFCVDYRLSCDKIINCPWSSNDPINQMLLSSSLFGADESSADLVCYSPPINWFLIVVATFSICIVLILCFISYVGVLRRYSPRRYMRLRNRCLRCSFFCLPAPLRPTVSSVTPAPSRNDVDISSLKLPVSPPTYASVERAEMHNQMSTKRLLKKRRNQSHLVPKSGNALPPSYSDEEDEIEVIPNGVIQKLHTLTAVRPIHSQRTRKTISPLTKPLPYRYQRLRPDRNFRVEFRVLLRRIVNRRRNRMRNTQLNQSQQAPNTNQELLPSQSVEESSTPLPNYNEFLSGEFPRFPEIVFIDYIQPPSSDRVRRLYRGRRRRHSRRF